MGLLEMASRLHLPGRGPRTAELEVTIINQVDQTLELTSEEIQDSLARDLKDPKYRELIAAGREAILKGTLRNWRDLPD